MQKLTWRQLAAVGSMLFGLFFGAGNLIFPVAMGQLAGRNLWAAAAGFLITGVGLPLLGVAALGLSRESGLLALSSRVGRGYGLAFTCALYLTIGPFFAIPRCATVSYTVGIAPLVPGGGAALGVFSLAFFAVVLFFSLRPGQILTWVGKVLNPLFLAFLAVLVLRALAAPLGQAAAVEPAGAYRAAPFATGLLEGYNTMDALAGLAFGILVVQAIRRLGVRAPGDVAVSTVCAGVFSSALMAGIYLLYPCRRAKPRPVCGGGQRRRSAGPDRGGLLRPRRRADPGGNGDRRLPENGGRPDHQLRRNLCRNLPARALLPGVGGGVLPALVFDREPWPGRHPGLVAAGAHGAVSAGHCADPADAGRPAVWR